MEPTSPSPTPAASEPDGPPVIASIGRLEHYKGHHRVIAAFPDVLEREPEARLLVVGTGPYEAELRRQAAELGIAARVEFTSTPADDPGGDGRLCWGDVSLVVLISEFETHPLVALEAAAAGRRLLVADASGLAELAADGFARAIPLDEGPDGVGRAIVEELGEATAASSARSSAPGTSAPAELLELYRSLA